MKPLPLTKRCLIPEDPATFGPERDLCQRCGLFKACQNCGLDLSFHEDEPGKLNRCREYQPAITPFMKPDIPKNWTGKVFFVGEGPGEVEDREGSPWRGKAGKLIRSEAEVAGIKKEDAAFGNSNRCRPPHNATPTMTQVRCCRPGLLWELRELNPEYVVALGVTAARALTNDGQASVAGLRGRPLTIPGLAREE